MTLDDAKISARDRSKAYAGTRYVVRPYPGPVDHFEDRAEEDLLSSDFIVVTYQNGMAVGGMVEACSRMWPGSEEAKGMPTVGYGVPPVSVTLYDNDSKVVDRGEISDKEFLERNRLISPPPWRVSSHPVDALKDLGVEMTPEAEAAARAVCDEPVTAAWKVGSLTRGGFEIWCPSLTDAEKAIASIEMLDPDGVHAGDYYIDGPCYPGSF